MNPLDSLHSDGIATIAARASALGRVFGFLVAIALIAYGLFEYARLRRRRGHVTPIRVPARRSTSDLASDEGRDHRFLDAA